MLPFGDDGVGRDGPETRYRPDMNSQPPAPMRLFRILRVSGGRRRKGARVLTPFVGREEDVKVLARRWERVRAGEGQFVLIVGEPGIGKSRLVEEFRARVGGIPHSLIEWTSSQLLQNTPLHPITEWGRVRFGGAEVSAERRFAELESVLAEIKLDPAEHAPLVAPLVDIPVPPDRLPDLPPDEVHRRQLAAMVDWALAGARVQPLVLVFEDLQWFDPSSIDLIRMLSDRGAEAPLLIVSTARPEFQPRWSLRSHHSVISLPPLDAAQVARMVAEISSRRALSAEVVKGLSDRAGGVPLFVEEVTRLLIERGERVGAQAIRRPCGSRWPRASTRWDRRAKSRKSARCWDGVFPIYVAPQPGCLPPTRLLRQLETVGYAASSSSSIFAALRSGVAKPSVNQL